MTSKLHEKAAAHGLQSAAWRKVRAAAVGLAVVVANAAWAAPTVIFAATDLADTTVGQDLWRYDYTITGPVDAFGAINLLFSPANYADLVSQTSDANLSLLDLQPDPLAPADGIVFASLPNGLLSTDSTGLSVEFVWLGGAGRAPGAQTFEIVDGNGGAAGTGVTRAQSGGTVPEPSALLLTATALLALTALRKRGVSA